MSVRNQKFLDNWKSSREGGFKRFMIVEGGIFGTLLFVLLLIYNLFTETLPHPALSVDTFYMFIWYILSGIFIYAPIMWWYNERLFKKHTNQD